MTETEIKQMLAQGERLTLECKKAKTELPKSVWESYSAFANTIGGYILLGIDEKIEKKRMLPNVLLSSELTISLRLSLIYGTPSIAIK